MRARNTMGAAAVMLLVMMITGCSMLGGLMTPAEMKIVRELAIREVQPKLAEEGVVMSEKELGKMYDIVTKSDTARELSAVVEANPSAVKWLREAIAKYKPKVEGSSSLSADHQ